MMTKKECRAALIRLGGAVNELVAMDDRVNAAERDSAEEGRACAAFDNQVWLIVDLAHGLLEVER
jgi:hypothetical protein